MRFLFFDEVLDYEPGKRVLGKKTYSFDGAYFTEHFPTRPVVPATLVMESFAQVAGWFNYMLHDCTVRMVVALVEEARLLRQVRVGETVHFEVALSFRHHDGSTVGGEARVGDEVVGRVERLVFANQVVPPGGFSRGELRHFDYVIECSPALARYRR